MSRKGWKQVERNAAALFTGGKRFPANMGGRLDFEADDFIGQVKNTKTHSLAAIEALAIEMEEIGEKWTKPGPKLGVVVLKRSAGAGNKTPHLIVMTETVWLSLAGSSTAEQRALNPRVGGSNPPPPAKRTPIPRD